MTTIFTATALKPVPWLLGTIEAGETVEVEWAAPGVLRVFVPEKYGVFTAPSGSFKLHDA